jgi:hypothetical protein
MNRLSLKYFIGASLFLVVGVLGCKKEPPKTTKGFNLVVEAIQDNVGHKWCSPEIKERADLAISLWRNGNVDPKPILIQAIISKYEDQDQIYLTVSVFNEEVDTLGFGIREEHTKEDGTKKVLEEVYPIFVHLPQTMVEDLTRNIPVNIRTTFQRKDEKLWREYVVADYIKLKREYIRKHKNSSRSARDVYYSAYPETLPSVWISLPDPNKVDVTIWVYDKDGHKSDSVELLDLTKVVPED